jgi:hypothetical protein
LEREFWLLDKKNQIVMPDDYGFPIDEFGFLVEIRTHAHPTAKGLLNELNRLTLAHKAQAKSLGLRLTLQHRRFLGKNLINCLSKKYHWDTLPDLTANIYSTVSKTHATGIDSEFGTAGIHIHFSKRDIHGRRVQLPIRTIVLGMDARFNREIAGSERVCGEYEIKPYGFEYRSLPATINVKEAVSFAFFMLNKP